MQCNTLGVVQWINQLPEGFPTQALSQCKVGNNQYLLLQCSKRTVCVPMFSFTQIQLLLFFVLMQLFCVTVALYCNCSCCFVPMQHCRVIVALSSNCHHCFVLIQHCCVTFALSNNRYHHHFVLMQLCCVTVTLIGDISILIS